MTGKFSNVLVGADTLLTQCGDLFLSRGHPIQAVVTNAPKIATWAESQGIPVVPHKKGYAGDLKSYAFDYLWSIANLTIIPDEVLALPKRAAFNFHDGPLPRFAGVNAPVWAILEGATDYGITWHEMVTGIDEGAIVAQSLFELSPDETALSLNARCFEAALRAFGELVVQLEEDRVERKTQSLENRSYYGRNKRPARGAFLDFERPTQTLTSLARALDHGPYPNPVAMAKVYGQNPLVVAEVRAADPQPGALPGQVLSADGGGLRVATTNGAVTLGGLRDLNGQDLDAAGAAERLGVAVHGRLAPLPETIATRFDGLSEALAQVEGRWTKELAKVQTAPFPLSQRSDEAPQRETLSVRLSDGSLAALSARFGGEALEDLWVLALAVVHARLAGTWELAFAHSDPGLREEIKGMESIVATEVPWRMGLNGDLSFAEALTKLRDGRSKLRSRKTFLQDLLIRQPDLRREATLLPVAVAGGDVSMSEGPHRVLVQRSKGAELYWNFDARQLDRIQAERLAGFVVQLLEGAAANPDTSVSKLDFLPKTERDRILQTAHGPTLESIGASTNICLHQVFEERVAKTPDAKALTFRDETISYAELDARANRLAVWLRQQGAGPDTRIGIHIPRSLDMVVGVLGTLKAGAAYVPLDPNYPAERLKFMAEDAGLLLVLSESTTPNVFGNVRRELIDKLKLEDSSNQSPSGVTPENLAYMIYTSGSTGTPKGVMVEHRNVIAFFSGMDEYIVHDEPGVWLAVTSLSFDISVLELLWTLTRGFQVVLHRADDETRPPLAPRSSAREIDFSLFMWGADDARRTDKYELMFETARFGDKNGFRAIWTPERHFHSFGGPFPNPAVTGAAIAAVTKNLQIRAGSCVLPLHHPARVAEDWAVIDNISQGRAALSFAAGWQPDDFLIRPENYKDAKAVMLRDIDVVRRLWRGEAVSFPGPLGKDVEVLTQPRPLTDELPFWVTTAGNVETYRAAGASGANVLTHLLGQTIEEVGEKIKVYREARAGAGLDPNTGIVSLMLHTFVGDSDDEVRDIVRDPMKGYLSSATFLLKSYAWTFPAFKRPKGAQSARDLDLSVLPPDEFDAIMEHGFRRYFESSGLFGTLETCAARIEAIRAVGVDDVACMIDYGVGLEDIRRSFKLLAELRNEVSGPAPSPGASDEASVASLIRKYGVTHLQCTPSMARMLLGDPTSKEALTSIKHIMVGGEAFPTEIAKALDGLGPKVTNMYGPTETTIWSSVEVVAGSPDPVTIGRPIRGTTLYITDAQQNLLPLGVPGELLIGGAGVVRGYHDRAELTAERFIPDRFVDGSNRRLYRTGDLAVLGEDGRFTCLGRLDHQVKIRGYRVELGEIETRLEEQAGIQQAVVVLRKDSAQLVAYLVTHDRAPPDTDRLKAGLGQRLPDFMVPSIFVRMDALPLTPNGKVDRKALPAPSSARPENRQDFVEPRSEVEQAVAEIWADELNIKQVGVHDDFFEIGGHSLLAAQVVSRLREQFEVELSLAVLFRLPSPTVEHLAVALEDALIAQLEGMSDEEAQALLNSPEA